MPLMPLHDHRLSWAQRKALHERLVDRATVLRGDIHEALHPDAAPEAALANHRRETDDDAVADLETALDVAGLSRDARELNEVYEAMRRIETAAYGACVGCGAPIAWERLLARPQVTRCTRCEAAAEHATSPPPSL